MIDWFTLALGIFGSGAWLLLGYALGSQRQYRRDSEALQYLAGVGMIHPNCANLAQRQMDWER